MKKLLVLAALSAMAMGVQAEYTVNIPGAQAVYRITALPDGDGSEDIVISAWKNQAKLMLCDETVARGTFGGETWAETYDNAESLFIAIDGKGLKLDEAGFSFPGEDIKFWGILALTDATELSPGAAYSVYYGTSDVEGSQITIQGDAFDSGFLRTDASPVPEPTSGLLLLLGVAGLALKRKRA